ncbi:MAG: beta-galactosidase [Clostridia bacterium]|nr:beta-galactosidase [Clostridia bacterium]
MERLLKIGTVKPIHSRDIEESRLGLGMEKLDRDAFDPEKVYDRVAALGVKWIRIQSGWQKTERTEGVYDFAWLDRQVDELLARGLKPWLCLCYGNIVYDDLAKEYYGAVGCTPIRTERAYAAWLKYVYETVKHFTGRIEYYEIWNEAEGNWTWRPVANVKEYAEFCVKTAKEIKSADANAKVITGSHYQDSMEFFNEEFTNGTIAISDAVTYHSYHYDETYSMQRVAALKALIKHYGGHAEIIQGESGSQSKSGGNGALGWIRTNQDMQTKQILRHTVADILSGVKFTSVFSCVDMAENLDAKADEPITTCGYFGLLGADFDPKTGTLMGDYYEKPSYYAFQNLCALFNENVTPSYIPVIFTPQWSSRLGGYDCPTREIIYGGIEKKNGACAFVYWRSTDMVTFGSYEGSATFELSGVAGDVHLIDPMDGNIYEIPAEIMTRTESNLYTFKNIPIKDYPLFITFGDF